MLCINRLKIKKSNLSRYCTNANVCKLLYKRKMNEGDNPPIGIILCSDKSDTLVKYTLPEGQNQVYASKYMLFIPTEEEFGRKIILERSFIENKWTIVAIKSLVLKDICNVICDE